MTDRTVKVNLVAQVNNYIAGMEKAGMATKVAGTEAEKLVAKREGFRQVGTALLAMGTVAAAGVIIAVKSFADFDAKMSQVKTLAHATADEMDSLSKAALTLGQKIGFSAVQTADAEVELVKAGLSVSNIMSGALKGSLELAAAGQIEVGKATEIATIALTQFGLKGKDVPHVADLLAAGADKALGGVADLGEALKSGGLVAAQFGLSLDDTIGTLSAFANAGLIGETAGTDLRQMLLKLANPAAESSKTMKDLGISLYDASGKFVGITNLSGQLKDKLSALTPEARNSALAIIFGSRAIAGANVLYKEGAKGIGDWINNVNSSGFAAQQAAGKMDNLKGDISKLVAAFQTDLIEAGSNANGVLRGTVQVVTNLVTSFSSLPGPAQGVILAVGAVVAVVGLLGGGILTLVPKIAALKVGIQELNTSMRTVATAGGVVALAITALVTVVSIFSTVQSDAEQTAKDLSETLDAQTGKVTQNTRAYVADKLVKDGTIDAAKKLGVATADLIGAYLQEPVALAKVTNALKVHDGVGANYRTGVKGTTIATDDLSGARLKLSGVLNDGKSALDSAGERQQALADAATSAAGSTENAAKAYKTAADQAKGLADQIAQLTDQINTANGVGQDAVSANASYQKALAAADETIQKARDHVKGFSLGIDESTASGSANADMLSGLAKASEDAGKKQLSLDGNTANYQKTLADGRQAVIDRAIALGATADQAQALADKVAAIPTDKEIKIIADTAAASAKLDSFFTMYNGRVIKPHVMGGIGGFASGGFTGNISPAAVAGVVHGREFVSTAKTTANPNNRAALDYMQSGGVIRGYEAGGYVTPVYTPARVQYAPNGPNSDVNVHITNKSGARLSDLIDARVQANGVWQAVDLDGGSNS